VFDLSPFKDLAIGQLGGREGVFSGQVLPKALNNKHFGLNRLIVPNAVGKPVGRSVAIPVIDRC
jgi:hypothetical protein